MSSINQKALEDLADISGKKPEDLSPNAFVPFDMPAKTGVTIKVPEEGEGETPITDAVRNRLADPSNQLLAMRGNIKEVESMGDVLDYIENKASISMSDANDIAARFEGFTSRFKPNDFTKIASRVGYIEANTFMKNKLKLRREEINLSFGAFFDDVVTEAEGSFKSYSEFYGEALKNDLVAFRSKALPWLADPEHINKQYVTFDDLVNLATDNTDYSDREDYDTAAMCVDPKDFIPFIKAVKDYHRRKKSNLITCPLLKTILDQLALEDFIQAEERVNAYGAPYTCLDLIKALSSSYLPDLLEKFESVTKQSIDTLKNLESEKKVNRSNFKEVSRFVVENGESFDLCADYCHYYSENIDALRRLLISASEILDYFIKDK